MRTRLIAGVSVLAMVAGTSSLVLAQGQQKMEGGSAQPGVSQGAQKGSNEDARSRGGSQTEQRGPSNTQGGNRAPDKSTSAPRSDRNATAPKSDEGKKSATESHGNNARRNAEEKGTTNRNRNAEDKGTTNRDRTKAADEQRSRTGDQRSKTAQPSTKGDTPQKATQDRSKATDTRERTVTGAAPKGTSGVTTGSVTAPSRVELTGERRTQVLGVFRQHRSEAHENVNVQVEIGRPVPRTVKLYVIPQEIIDVVPEYRRYRYFIVGDIVLIVDPDRFVIIDVLPIEA